MQLPRSHIALNLGDAFAWLDADCGACGATGTVYCTLWEDWQADYEEGCKQLGQGAGYLDPEEVAKYPDCPEEHECPECGGHGTLPTPAGLAILELVRRYKS